MLGILLILYLLQIVLLFFLVNKEINRYAFAFVIGAAVLLIPVFLFIRYFRKHLVQSQEDFNNQALFKAFRTLTAYFAYLFAFVLFLAAALLFL